MFSSYSTIVVLITHKNNLVSASEYLFIGSLNGSVFEHIFTIQNVEYNYTFVRYSLNGTSPIGIKLCINRTPVIFLNDRASLPHFP